MRYRIFRDRLVVEIEPLSGGVTNNGGFLCSIHADRMTVPRDWVIDDRRDPHPRLFRGQQEPTITRRRSTRRHVAPVVESEQLELSEASESLEISRIDSPPSATMSADAQPETTTMSPLSPLLDRAFRGTRLEH